MGRTTVLIHGDAAPLDNPGDNAEIARKAQALDA